MKNYTMLITLKVVLGEFENDQDAAVSADEAANEFMDAYVVNDTKLFEVDTNGVSCRRIDL